MDSIYKGSFDDKCQQINRDCFFNTLSRRKVRYRACTAIYERNDSDQQATASNLAELGATIIARVTRPLDLSDYQAAAYNPS